MSSNIKQNVTKTEGLKHLFHGFCLSAQGIIEKLRRYVKGKGALVPRDTKWHNQKPQDRLKEEVP